MVVNKTKQPTLEYLSELRGESESIGSLLSVAKKELYKLTPVAKLGDPQFETWRKKCTDLTKDFLKLQDEIERVERIVDRR